MKNLVGLFIKDTGYTKKNCRHCFFYTEAHKQTQGL
jgi:hypothetical protein